MNAEGPRNFSGMQLRGNSVNLEPRLPHSPRCRDVGLLGNSSRRAWPEWPSFIVISCPWLCAWGSHLGSETRLIYSFRVLFPNGKALFSATDHTDFQSYFCQSYLLDKSAFATIPLECGQPSRGLIFGCEYSLMLFPFPDGINTRTA